MVKRMPFDKLPFDDLGWAMVRWHSPFTPRRIQGRGDWDTVQGWSDEVIAPQGGLALKASTNVEVVVLIIDGAIMHRDSLGNESRIEAGSALALSAGTGIHYTEYNAEPVPTRLFQIWISSTVHGGAPAYSAQQCPGVRTPGSFVTLASGFHGDGDALPIRARARVLAASLRMGDTTTHAFQPPRRAYVVPATGAIDINDVRVSARDGASIEDVDVVSITAVEDTEILMVDHSLRSERWQHH